jgi:hypothetical protein
MDAHDEIPARPPNALQEHHDPWANEVQCQTLPPSNGQQTLSAMEKDLPPQMIAQAALALDQSALQAFFAPLSASDRQKGLSDVINASIQNYVSEPGDPARGLVQMNWNQSDDALTVNRITPHERTFGVLSTERPPTEMDTKTVKIPLSGVNGK